MSGSQYRVLWGVDDEWIPIERGRELARLMPECKLIEIPDCGHLMQEDAPEAIVSTALTFFQDIPARSVPS